MLTLLTGLAAGAAHVLTGPDHLAALAPLAIEDPRKATRLGFRWGLGHGVGAAILGALAIFASASLDVAAISAWSECLVGVVLMMVGAWAFRRSTRMVIHSHDHEHQAVEADAHEHAHQHFHVHDKDADHDAPEAHRGHSHAAFFVGLIHGAAGTGHVLAVIPSLALPPAEAAVYLGAYFVAAVLSMTAFGALVGAVARRQGPVALKRIMYGASGAAVSLGAVWVVNAWPA